MFEEEKYLFVRTIEDLKMKVESTDLYEILNISALLRKLFLDDYPLVNKVNSEYKLKIIYHIGLPSAFILSNGQNKNWFLLDGFDPETGRPGRENSFVSIDRLLSATVIRVNSNNYSVKDIIKYEANIKGGVHSGKVQNEKEQTLEDIKCFFNISGGQPSRYQLQAIGRVVLKGLNELYIVIKKNI
jgi:hypothetical protein